MAIALTFLGTGTSQGIPVIGCRCAVCTSADPRDSRLRTSALLEVNGLNLLIDTGPDLRQQMLNSGTLKVDAVLYTHAHSDHLLGLDDIRPFNFMQRKHMPLYGSQHTIVTVRKVFGYAFDAEPYPGAPMLATVVVDPLMPFQIEGVTVIPLPVEHGNMPTMGYRVGNLSYITDAKHISARTMQLLEGTEILVLNALRITEHHSHFTLSEALEVAQAVGAQTTYLTHISHQLGTHADVSALLPPNVRLGFDGLRVGA